jgi:hypothetical protein
VEKFEELRQTLSIKLNELPPSRFSKISKLAHSWSETRLGKPDYYYYYILNMLRNMMSYILYKLRTIKVKLLIKAIIKFYSFAFITQVLK